jgi:hypothetical protein
MAERNNEFEEINKRLQSLEHRLSRLESGMITAENEKSFPEEVNIKSANIPEGSLTLTEDDDKGLESQIGRFGLAWLGSIVLFFGITFLTQYLMNIGHHVLSEILGYLSAASIFLLANYLKKTNSHLAFMFKLNAQLLLFYITLRLHFFSASPLISSKTATLILLLLIVAFQTYLSIRNKSQVFAVLALFFSLTTAVVSDATHFMLLLVFLTSAGTIYLFVRYSWRPLLVISIFMTYMCFLLWLFGNPFMGHPLQLISEQHFGVIYLFGLGASYSITLLFRNKDASSDDFLTGVIFINGILFTILLLLVVLRFFFTGYVGLFAIITICCLIFSTILHAKSDWNFASAFYALYGFMAMSISLYGLVGLPEVYLLLSVQSLIVVSMALWFRNRLIVVMNSLLFLTILSVYLMSSDSVNGVNFSFALVALVSARIINWKRSRLKIETDLMRNLYMLEGFIMMLFALNHALPKQFVTLSWSLAALLYFLVSILLKNVKYRYMALGTMIAAAFYLFLVDLARIELIYRVLALLFLAAISIGISMYYTSRIKRSDK